MTTAAVMGIPGSTWVKDGSSLNLKGTSSVHHGELIREMAEHFIRNQTPFQISKWSQLSNMKLYRSLFKEHENNFEE